MKRLLMLACGGLALVMAASGGAETVATTATTSVIDAVRVYAFHWLLPPTDNQEFDRRQGERLMRAVERSKNLSATKTYAACQTKYAADSAQADAYDEAEGAEEVSAPPDDHCPKPPERKYKRAGKRVGVKQGSLPALKSDAQPASIDRETLTPQPSPAGVIPAQATVIVLPPGVVTYGSQPAIPQSKPAAPVQEAVPAQAPPITPVGPTSANEHAKDKEGRTSAPLLLKPARNTNVSATKPAAPKKVAAKKIAKPQLACKPVWQPINLSSSSYERP